MRAEWLIEVLGLKEVRNEIDWTMADGIVVKNDPKTLKYWRDGKSIDPRKKRHLKRKGNA